ncbi:MAG: hypothetical protein PHV78_03795 [Patescibacteria group bacterium]|nr:hypothetical protein [Patescibacteria group bacterium]MDD5121491.1 hypothetical protein [Patescibacteria group bacterium]MDD5222191.1 hypothetical protein [Patescibacteria group bacterium]MDD5396347.1 hypothetical protein [Patescibacteria group bacterium]
MTNVTTYQKNLIESLAANEESLSRLYHLYSNQFNQFADFWQQISQEELEHGKWIKNLLNLVNEDKILFEEGRFSKWAIDNYAESVKARITSAETRRLNLKEEAQFSLSLEESMIENKFFEVFQGDLPELIQVLLALEVSTNSHIERLKKFLIQI